MRILALLAFLTMWANISAHAQEPCNYGSDDPFKAMAKDLSQATSCAAAAAKMSDCAWGSSADTQLAPIVVAKCEKTFYRKLSPAAQKRYADEMQSCAYEYAQQEGTIYMSAAALCQVDIAARYAADPVAAGERPLRASFDCAKAKTPLEIAICSDKSLGLADIVLWRSYSGWLKNSNKQERAALIQSEKEWLQTVTPECGLSPTPASPKSIECIRSKFEDRFLALDSCSDGITDCLRRIADGAEMPHVVPSLPTKRASFDCDAPSSALEIVICADADLGQTDIELAQTYRDASAVMYPMQRKELIASERKWLRFVSQSCPLGAVGGIPPVLARACVSTAFQTRIAQLRTCPQKKEQERISCLNEFHLEQAK
jgi:uncharacterized protein